MTYEELRKLAEDVSNEAKRKIRWDFHLKYGRFYKCKACGGFLGTSTGDGRQYPYLTTKKCPGGEHEYESIESGYSFLRSLFQSVESGSRREHDDREHRADSRGYERR
jgi:hypothetical protein